MGKKKELITQETLLSIGFNRTGDNIYSIKISTESNLDLLCTDNLYVGYISSIGTKEVAFLTYFEDLNRLKHFYKFITGKNLKPLTLDNMF